MAKLKAEGRSAGEIAAAELDEKWGGGFMKPDRWLGIVIESME